MDVPLLRVRVAQNLRFDGLWWRKFAYLGSVYGPEWWKRYSPPVIAAILFALIRRNREGATANMQQILGNDGASNPRAAALRMFVEFAHCMTESMEYYGPHPRPIQLDVPACDAFAEALAEGNGAVIVTGHFGNWDIGAKRLREYGRPVNIVMAREVNASTHEYVRAAREHVGVRVLYSDTSVFSSLNMIRALRRNEVVALQLDRIPGSARSVPFFGSPARFPIGPFVLARLSGAPLIPVFIPRLGTRHYAIRIGSRFTLSRDVRDGHALNNVMTAVVRELEAIVREFPTQWFQFVPFWPSAAAPREVAPPAREAVRERIGARR